jgi:hypothetical protein
MFEYATTSVSTHQLGGNDALSPPRPPEGGGWALVGSSANETTRFHDWRREVKTAPTTTKK